MKRRILLIAVLLTCVSTAMTVVVWWQMSYGLADQLISAIREGDRREIEAVLAQPNLDINASGSYGVTPLLQALLSHDMDTYTMLLERGADPNICDSRGRCVMNQAAKESDPAWLKLALEHGGDPDVVNLGNRHAPNSTPLFYAIYERRAANISLLVEAGANLNHQDGVSHTPMREAADHGLYDCVVLLLTKGADPSLKDQYGQTVVDRLRIQEEQYVHPEAQVEWFRKARGILISRGLLTDVDK